MSTSTDQPRTPAGSPQGGQFVANPGGEEGPDLGGDDARFGPNTGAVQAILDRAGTLTPDEVKKIWVALASDWPERFAARTGAWDASELTQWDDAMVAALDVVTGGDASRYAALEGVQHAIQAELARDLISDEDYNLLMAPWRAGIGDTK